MLWNVFRVRPKPPPPPSNNNIAQWAAKHDPTGDTTYAHDADGRSKHEQNTRHQSGNALADPCDYVSRRRLREMHMLHKDGAILAAGDHPKKALKFVYIPMLRHSPRCA